MRPLQDKLVLALDDASESALARLLATLGAQIKPVQLASLETLLPTADMLIDRQGLALLEDAGYSRARIESLNPRLIHVSVTAFGSLGPRSRWRGSELVASAMGGTLRLTGDPDRPPVKEALDACGFHADMAAAAGAMAALHEAAMTGRGQHVDISIQEVAFSRNVNGVLVWQFDRRKLHRVGGALNYGRATVRCIWPLADGFCFHTLMTGRFGAPANQALSDWMDEVGVENPLRGTDWTRYNRSTLAAQTRAVWERAIETFFRTRTRNEIATEGRKRGINATVVAEPSDVLKDPHLAARNFWTGTERAQRPGRFVAVNESSHVSVPRTYARSSRSGPLAGVRVLDFSWALVGSITTKILGDLGCDVVKVESRTRPCLSRIDVQVSVSRPDDFDDKPWFAHLNTSKRSLALDLKRPESRELLDPLIQWADVVVENFSPGTMSKLGLGYRELSARNPGLVMISGSVYGQTGPLAPEWGVDGTGAALSGRTFLTGWPDRDPVIPGAVPYGDVIVPYVMAAAAGAALTQRLKTGRGCHVDASMYEICAQQMYDAIAAAASGERPKRTGNDDAHFLHQGVYPTRDADRWIAITLETESQWAVLKSLANVNFPYAIADWTSQHTDSELLTSLQEHGLAAGVVQDIEDLMEHDPQLAARSALIRLDHPKLGAFGHVRTPISFSRSELAPYRAPALGEHNIEIAREICGLPSTRVAELDASGVFK